MLQNYLIIERISCCCDFLVKIIKSDKEHAQIRTVFTLLFWEKLRLSILAALRRTFECCHHAKATPEQLRRLSQARGHFPFHNSFPRCMIIPHIHRKQNNKPLNMLTGSFSQGQVHRIACLPKELLPCFPYLFWNYPFPKELKCEKISLTRPFYLEITLSVSGHWVFTSWTWSGF